MVFVSLEASMIVVAGLNIGGLFYAISIFSTYSIHSYFVLTSVIVFACNLLIYPLPLYFPTSQPLFPFLLNQI